MKRRTAFETPPLDLIEEAFHLLRQADARTLLCHLIGALPFVLGLLYFWSDMARGIDAARHLPAAALGLTTQFVWLKIWQAIFAQNLFARLRGEARGHWTAARLGRLAVAQIVLQPAGLFLLPATLVLTMPFGWAFAFFQNVTALGGGDDDLRSTARRAWEQARFWQMQNHQILFVFVLFSGIAFVNLASAGMLVPFLLKMLFGVESAITRSPVAAFNSTFLAAAAALTWLCVDPFLKAVYVLRCFHGSARRTGADLLAELQSAAAQPPEFRPASTGAPTASRLLAPRIARPVENRRSVRAVMGAVLLWLFGLCCLGNIMAAPNADSDRPAAAPAASIVSDQLDRAIGEVLQQREFTWRLPREHRTGRKDEHGWFAQFIESVFEVLGEWMKKLAGWMEDLWRWVFKPPTFKPGTGPALDWTSALKILFVVLIAACVGILAFFLVRLWRDRQRRARPALEATAAPPLDLADEQVGAEQLPEDGWLRLGQELLAEGDLRLAVRAFYLASLAHLAGSNLITLARFKSNLDYARELQRRGHVLPGLVAIFGENVAAFERIWYGRHEASPELVAAFSERVERLRAAA